MCIRDRSPAASVASGKQSSNVGRSVPDTSMQELFASAAEIDIGDMVPHCEGDEVVVEESGPVEYCEDELEEGVDDQELEQLAYKDDPLLHSDYEDEGKPCAVT